MNEQSNKSSRQLTEWAKYQIALTLAVCVFGGVFLLWSENEVVRQTLIVPAGLVLMVGLMALKSKRPERSKCSKCDRAFYPAFWVEQSGLCPYCRHAKLPAEGRKQSLWKSLAILSTIFLAFSTLATWVFSEFFSARIGGRSIVLYPLLTVLFTVGIWSALLVIIAVKHILKLILISRPGRALAIARASAGDEGEPEQAGRMTVWGLGAKAPLALLDQQKEAATERFQAIIGAPLETSRSLDVFVFAKREAFERFLIRAGFGQVSDHDGVFIPWKTLTIACTMDLPPLRLTEFERTLRVLFAYDALANYKTIPVPSWLQVGLANVVAASGDRDERARLDRKMRATIARGRAFEAAEFFDRKPWFLAAALRDVSEHRNFATYIKFISQSWSVVDFLCGEGASPAAKANFQAFLREIEAKEPMAVTFERNFGFGYEKLLENWKQAILSRNIDVHAMPPRRAADLLVDRVLPVIRDQEQPLAKRVAAVRELGRAGYSLGANELIEQLDSRDEGFREEVVWALEAISGFEFGGNSKLWRAWWNELEYAQLIEHEE